MGAKGRNMVLYVGDDTSPGNFTAVAGLQTSGLSISNSPIESTNIDSGEHRELLGGGLGNRTYSISGSGVFLDDTVIQQIEDAVQAASKIECQLVFENGDFYQGFFMVSSFEKSSGHTDVLLYSMSLEGASQIQFSRTIPLLAACAVGWASQTHPGSSAGSQRAKFNESFGSPLFVIAGGSGSAGSVAWSPDGINWTLGTTNASQYTICLGYSPDHGTWVAGGWSNSLESSSDGKTFTTRSHPHATNKNNVAYGNGRFIVVSANVSTFEKSDDGGITWSVTGSTGGSAIYRSIATDGVGTWLAGNNNAVYKSTDNGDTWALAGTTGLTGTDRDIVWASGLNLWVFCLGQ